MRALLLLVIPGLFAATDPAAWPRWRGPNENGVAKGSAPVEWSDTKNIIWKANIPGRGHSSPVLWGDLIFLTTAIPAKPVAEARLAVVGAGGRVAGLPPGWSISLL